MIKHASSHGLSVFMCSIISAIIVELLILYLPIVLEPVSKLSLFILTYLPIPIPVEQLNIVLLASLLAALWGIFFKLRFVK